MNTKRKFIDELKFEGVTYIANLRKRINEINVRLETIPKKPIREYWKLKKELRELEREERKLTRY